MFKSKFIRWFLVMIAVSLFTACGGGDGDSSKRVDDNQNGVIITKLQPADPEYVVYEDAEDGSTDRWRIYDKNPDGATVSNLYDSDRGSSVIELSGAGTKNGYMLGSWGGSKAWNNREDTLLKWSMKSNEKFYIYIRIETKKGNRYILYRPEDTNRTMSSNKINIGIGESAMDGTWHNFERDIAVDLKSQESDNELIAINAFLIKGSVRIDDIKMLKSSKEIYEDAEDGTTEGWIVNDSDPAGATISNIYDSDRKSRVIELSGDKTKNRYTLGESSGENAWENSQYKVLKWSMKYAENFSIEISTQTSDGYRRIRYTQADVDGGLDGNTISIGLGSTAKSGTWQTFVRDLEADIQKYDAVTLLEVNAFAIRGSGMVDDVEMLKREKTLYSDGSDSSVWRVYDKKPAGATITTVDDGNGNSVIKLQGDGLHNGFVLGSWSGSKAWYNREHKVLKWSMNYAEEFRIYIRLDTQKGDRYLEYRPTDIEEGLVHKKYIRYGLGVYAKNGTWQTFARDLEADLQKYESDNEIISVNGFFIKGSGLIDNVEMMYFTPMLSDNIAPVITLNGYNPTKLVVGETYNDMGAVITDDRDSNINVSVVNTVDTTTAGEYSVTYTATDSASNISEKVRSVIVIEEDTTPPVIELIGGNPMTISTRDTYNEEGAVATDNVDDSVDVTISGDVDDDTVGTYIVTYSAEDRFGNLSTKIRKVIVEPKKDTKYDIEYKGLKFYHKELSSSSYRLNQLSSDEFNALSQENKLIAADKLLGTLFFGYPVDELDTMIESGNFMDEIRAGLHQEQTDRAWLENYILDTDKFYQGSSYEPMVKILNRFYAMKKLDSYLFNNWTAYILTQTIMFSPAYELDTSERPNVSRVYNGLVQSIEDEESMRFITYKHMMSEDNWRRFRSPEDNGREMLEIFTLDIEDSHVPLAAKALQNWRLDPESNTLVIELNENIEPLDLFGTTIFNGDDFYRELVKSDAFVAGATKRLVDFFFFNSDESTKANITNTIISSNPESWRDILEQIIFSEEYLLHNDRAKKAEETFYSLAKKMDYQHFDKTAYYLRGKLEEMHQASMKYKLGKLDPVPLDTLSFAIYHKYIRESVLTRKSDPKYSDDYKKWSRQGWSSEFISFDKFGYDEKNQADTIDALINFIFKSTVARVATETELELFRNHIVQEGKSPWQFDMFVQYDDKEKQANRRARSRDYIARVVLEYISRLKETYQFQEVK